MCALFLFPQHPTTWAHQLNPVHRRLGAPTLMKIGKPDSINSHITRINPKQKLKRNHHRVPSRRIINLIPIPNPNRLVPRIHRPHRRTINQHPNKARIPVIEERRKRKLSRHTRRHRDSRADNPGTNPQLGSDGRGLGVHVEGLGSGVGGGYDGCIGRRVGDLNGPGGGAAFKVAVGDEAERRAGRGGRAGWAAGAGGDVSGRDGAAGGCCAGRVVCRCCGAGG
jgi:hypothetical protein